MDDTNRAVVPDHVSRRNDHQRLPTVPIALARTWMTRKIKSVPFIRYYAT